MSARRRGRVARRRGAGFLWFVLVGIPFFFLAAFIAVDASRLFLAHREAVNAVEAAALAGGFSFVNGQAAINPGEARANARSVITGAQAAGALRHLEVVGAYVQVLPDRTVTVALDYNVRNLTFLRAISIFFAQEGSGDVDGTVARTSFLCDPGTTGIGSDNVCTRPLG